MSAFAREENGQQQSNWPIEFTQFRWAYFGLAIPQVWSFEAIHQSALGNVGASVPIVFFIALSAGMLLFILLRHVAGERASALLGMPASILMAASTVPLLGIVQLPEPAILAGAAAGGVATALSYLSWAPLYAKMGLRDVVACAFGAMLFGCAIKLVFDLLVLPWTCLLIALPLFSPVLLSQARAIVPEPKVKPQLYFENAKNAFPLVILLGVSVCSFIIGMTSTVAIVPSYTPRWQLSLVHHGAEILASMLVLWWVFSFRGKLHYTNMWRAIVIIVATALLFLPNIGPDLVGWVLVLVGIGQTLLVAVMWTMLADVSHHSKVSPYTVFGFAWVAYALPVALGSSLGSVVAAQANASFLVALLSYALTVSAIITLNDRNFIEGRLFRDLDAAVPDQVNFESIDEKCAEIGAEHKLTKREVEVMKLLCKGRSKSYIAETLFISENTVRSHARHIYQKLNVHSKQEMMDLLISGGDR